jgi:uncharacterized repeat protein (TIGR01451 family)
MEECHMSKIVVALGLLVVGTAGGQTISWTRQFGTPAEDYAAALTAGPDGSIYVAGYTYGALEGSNAGGQDAFVRKYDADGNVLWTRQFGTAGDDYAYALTAGPGGIYVAGWTTGTLDGSNAGSADAFVRKYGADGNVLWTRQFGTPTFDYAEALTAGADGVYVAGQTWGDLGGSNTGGIDAFVRKYDADGNVLWTQHIGTAAATDTRGLAAGPDGIYVSGWTRGDLEGGNAGGFDAFVRKYDFNGNVLWTRQFGTAGDDYAYPLTAGPDGIYVAGYTTGALDGSAAGGYDAFVRKYDANGNIVWARQFGTAVDDLATGLTAGPDGIYVAGYTSGALAGSNAGQRDSFVRKYDFNGNVLWTRQIGTAGDDVATALTAGLDGIYLAGGTTGALEGSNAGSYDAFVIKITPATPPVFGLLPAPVVEATSPAGSVVTYTVTATDSDGLPLVPVCAPASGSIFHLGTTTVSCTATDVYNNSTAASFPVVVRDTTPPTLNLPATLTVYAASKNGAPVTYTVTATDLVDAQPTIICLPVSGSIFIVGTTTVNCSATDFSGNRSSGTFNVVVIGPDDLVLGKFASPVVQTGENLSYLIGVVNLGPATAYQVTVTDTLPAGTAFVSASWETGFCWTGSGGVSCSTPSRGTPCSISGGTVTCGIGTLAPFTLRNLGGAGIQVVVKVTAPAHTTIKNTASVTGANVDSHPGNNSFTATTVVTGSKK